MAETAIQWSDMVWNPVTGCRKVSPGCAHCYAERLAPRVFAGQAVPIHTTDEGHILRERPRRFTDVRCHPERLDQPLRWRKPRRVFANSMSDLFHEAVPDEFIVEVFGRMASAQRHTFQVLTKRPERMRSLLTRDFHERVARSAWETCERLDLTLSYMFPLPNVWLGVSVEDQRHADERIPALLDTPAALRFVSAEPLLGPVDLSRFLRSIDWIIVGGESGAQARPMDLAWARSLVEQGRAAGVAVFCKQLGRRPFVIDPETGDDWPLRVRDSHGGDMEEWPADLRVREFPEGGT